MSMLMQMSKSDRMDMILDKINDGHMVDMEHVNKLKLDNKGLESLVRLLLSKKYKYINNGKCWICQRQK